MIARPQASHVYLIQPKFPVSYWGLEHFMELTPFHAVFPPLGLLTLAALAPPEFRVTLCDANAGEAVDYDTDADIVGITGYIIQMADIFAIADEFRRRGKTVVLGGPLANLLPKECREHCDVLFNGEAEYTWPQFLRDYAAGQPAERYHQEEKIHLPDSPPPRLDLLKRRYAHGIVQCTRGCPFSCEFCDIIVMYGRKMRVKPIERVIEEVESWADAGMPQVFFADDNFIGNRAYAKELLRALAQWNGRRRHAVSFYTQASVDMVRDEELLELMRDANFCSVFLGIESPRKASLAETKKTQNEKLDLVAAIHKIQSYNLFIWAGMIVGFDADDVSIFEEQFKFLQEAGIPLTMLSVLLAVPKTPLYARLEAEGRLLDPNIDSTDLSHYVGTAGGTNFHPLRMTAEELKEGQAELFQRLYRADAFAERLLTNMARFHDVHYRPQPIRWSDIQSFLGVIRRYWSEGRSAWKFFWRTLAKAVWKSPRSVAQVIIHLGMFQHFCKVHAPGQDWNPWTAGKGKAPAPRLDSAPVETSNGVGETCNYTNPRAAARGLDRML